MYKYCSRYAYSYAQFDIVLFKYAKIKYLTKIILSIKYLITERLCKRIEN